MNSEVLPGYNRSNLALYFKKSKIKLKDQLTDREGCEGGRGAQSHREALEQHHSSRARFLPSRAEMVSLHEKGEEAVV